jgi:Sec-independent protein translocase protein TatA
MSSGELLLTLCITLFLFNPSKWPMLAHHAAKAWLFIQRIKQHALRFWKTQLDLYQLEENTKKAAAADKQYNSP